MLYIYYPLLLRCYIFALSSCLFMTTPAVPIQTWPLGGTSQYKTLFIRWTDKHTKHYFVPVLEHLHIIEWCSYRNFSISLIYPTHAIPTIHIYIYYLAMVNGYLHYHKVSATPSTNLCMYWAMCNYQVLYGIHIKWTKLEITECISVSSTIQRSGDPEGIQLYNGPPSGSI